MADPRIPQLPLDRVERVLARRREEAPDRESLARPYVGFELGLRGLLHEVLLLSFFRDFPCSGAAFCQPSGQ